MKYLSFLFPKIAAPADSLSQLEFYHGNYNQDAVKPILTSGLEGREEQGKSMLSPVKKGVYLASDFKYAMVYALGANMIGREFTPFNITEQPYGYIYTVTKENLKDVSPDEDGIGELVWRIYEGVETNLGSGDCFTLKRIAEDVATPNQLTRLKDGQYSYFAAVGKKIIPLLPDNLKIRMIQTGISFFNLGRTKVSGVYIFKRNMCHLLTGDISKDKPYMVYIKNYSQFDKATQDLEKVK